MRSIINYAIQYIYIYRCIRRQEHAICYKRSMLPVFTKYINRYDAQFTMISYSKNSIVVRTTAFLIAKIPLN